MLVIIIIDSDENKRTVCMGIGVLDNQEEMIKIIVFDTVQLKFKAIRCLYQIVLYFLRKTESSQRNL